MPVLTIPHGHYLRLMVLVLWTKWLVSLSTIAHAVIYGITTEEISGLETMAGVIIDTLQQLLLTFP